MLELKFIQLFIKFLILDMNASRVSYNDLAEMIELALFTTMLNISAETSTDTDAPTPVEVT